MSTPKQALADLEKGKAWPVYYLYGDEPFKVHEFVDKVSALLFGEVKEGEKKDLSFSIDRIDGTTQTGNDVLEAVQSMGLFGGGTDSKRMVVVRAAHQLKETEALSKTLMDAGKKSPWEDQVLILVAESLDGRKKFHQWLKKQGYALEFKPAKDSELLQWVGYLAKKTGAAVTPEAAQMLAVICDGSLYRLAQEIEKAWLFAGAEKGITLTPEHLTAVSSTHGTHEMIELVRAILEGKRTRALLLSEKLILGPEDALGLVGFITWAIKSPGRGYQGTIAGGVARVRKMIGTLMDLDQRLKGSGLEPQALIEEFILEQTKTDASQHHAHY